jgi:hypothetical protein
MAVAFLIGMAAERTHKKIEGADAKRRPVVPVEVEGRALRTHSGGAGCSGAPSLSDVPMQAVAKHVDDVFAVLGRQVLDETAMDIAFACGTGPAHL